MMEYLEKLREEKMQHGQTVKNTGEQGMFSHCLFLFLSSHILSEKKTFYGKTTEGKHSND